ncbi:hypothetical protein [Polyangium spumosum]|uniref:Outer membrane beta-barrel protein n=1 Tax=Polyangium spumosum TaxID=889282 RepID=A0A6N7PX74_9BACT|nr:hypothetical protein [Polyangium spumosum]MRG96117.1 hypothetical protein [Polyangium spumosum]
MVVPARLLALSVMAWVSLHPAEVFAQQGPCASPEPFHGFWGGGELQVRERVAGVPVLATARFSYRQMRYSPCVGEAALLPPGVGEASFSVGVPLFDNRRGGWLLQMAARGQGSQRASEPVSGVVTGAPAMAGHLNLWETPLPLIQLTGAASAAIVPQSRDVPLSLAYLGGVRVYALYGRHAQANLGIMVGGNNAAAHVVPSLAVRLSDVKIWSYRTGLGFEFRSPVEFFGGPVPVRWRLWGALTLLLEKLDESRSDRARGAQTPSPSVDLVRSPPNPLRRPRPPGR